MRNPAFHQLLDKCKEIHERKSHDYSKEDNVFSNFEYAAAVAGVSVDQVFLTLIGVKLARLKELLEAEKQPKNESIEDSFVDLITYSGIWGSYILKETNIQDHAYTPGLVPDVCFFVLSNGCRCGKIVTSHSL